MVNPTSARGRALALALAAGLSSAALWPASSAAAEELPVPGATSATERVLVAPQPAASGVNDLAGRDVAGLHFAPTHLLDGQQLVLNGVGVRAKMIIKVYAMGLYLPRPEPDAQALLRSDVPHHIVLWLLRDVDAERMRDGFGHAVLEHLPAAQVDAVRERVMALSQALMRHGDARRGEALALDYRPDLGTRVTLAGQVVCPDIPGADFNAAMLAMWLGPDAADGRLKAALLGAQP
jgi:hypothetical protein